MLISSVGSSLSCITRGEIHWLIPARPPPNESARPDRLGLHILFWHIGYPSNFAGLWRRSMTPVICSFCTSTSNRCWASRRIAKVCGRWPACSREAVPISTSCGRDILTGEAGFLQIQLDAIADALRISPDWTHFINLSGQCYPIKPVQEIRTQLALAEDQVFVDLRHFSTPPLDDWHLRWHPIIEPPHRTVKRAGPRLPPVDFELEHKGSQWSILPRAFCTWQQRAPAAHRIRRYLRGLLLSDELIIQSLVRNGPWRDRTAPHYGREIIWPGPKALTMADWPRLMASSAFFARKFDPAVDDQIVPALARKLGLNGRITTASNCAHSQIASNCAHSQKVEIPIMRIALIDPSLFTLPYDVALSGGLQAEGHEVTLFARRPGAEDDSVEGTPLAESFYRCAGSPLVLSMPKEVRLAVKGIDHLFSIAALGRRLSRSHPEVLHFQWLPLPLIDRWFLPGLRRVAPLVLESSMTSKLSMATPPPVCSSMERLPLSIISSGLLYIPNRDANG